MGPYLQHITKTGKIQKFESETNNKRSYDYEGNLALEKMTGRIGHDILNRSPDRRRSILLAISPEVEELVRLVLSSGRYKDEDEIIREALKLLISRDKLRADIEVGISELDSGARLEAGEVFRRLEEKISDLSSSTK
jgi:Arc/MetJ-type ribon-helix-helix transcriptional regulator